MFAAADEMDPCRFDLDAAVGHEFGPRQIPAHQCRFFVARAGPAPRGPGFRAAHQWLFGIGGDLDVRRRQRHVAQRELVMAQEIPRVEFDAQFGRHHANPPRRGIGELDTREDRARAVQSPGEMDVVESHGEPGAFRDEFFERGALFRDTFGYDAREHHAQRSRESQTKSDQHQTPRPM
jgi:hypothetical protein